MSLISYQPPVHFAFPQWPLPDVKNISLYLDGETSQLVPSAPKAQSSLSYQSDVPFVQCGEDPAELSFKHTFSSRTIVTSCARAVLYMSCSIPTGEHSSGAEFDVHVQLRKADANGKTLEHWNIPLEDCQANGLMQPPVLNKFRYLGPHGCLRARYSKITNYTSDGFPEYDFSSTQRKTIAKDEVVRFEIGLVQAGFAFEAGESLILKVSGHEMALAEYEFMKGKMPNYNQGMHTLHCGLGETSEASHLILPVIEDFNWTSGGLQGMNETYRSK